MSKFKKIQEIRIEIDKIDSKIIDLISARKDLVTKVVKFKEKNQIIDQKRINEILERLDVEAKKKRVKTIGERHLEYNDKFFYSL